MDPSVELFFMSVAMFLGCYIAGRLPLCIQIRASSTVANSTERGAYQPGILDSTSRASPSRWQLQFNQKAVNAGNSHSGVIRSYVSKKYEKPG
ncbi:hypothetical protein FHG87_020966 [Trinorchestia longiramus]|nr:hypothetical protein FHG87_020966 [Trinorchestia longiramus]